METRFNKRAHSGVRKAEEAEEALLQVREEANEDETRDVEEVAIPPKKKKSVKCSPKKLSKSSYFLNYYFDYFRQQGLKWTPPTITVNK